MKTSHLIVLASAAIAFASTPGSGSAAVEGSGSSDYLKSGTLDKSKNIQVPDTKEASDYGEKEKAVKTAPKDQTYTDDLIEGGDTFRKPSPNSDSQKIDVPDTDSLLEDLDDIAVTSPKDDKPVVLNDYDPANLGGSSKDKEEKDAKKGKKDKEKAKETAKDEKPAKSDEKVAPKKDIQGSTGTAPKDSSSPASDSTTESQKEHSSDKVSESPKTVSHDGESKKETNPFHSFTLACSMILVSEVGDKTFLIAALMAMKHARLTVFSAAISSLIVMTVLSALIGNTLPSLLPKKLTSMGAAVLFVIFGFKLVREGLQMSPDIGVEEEMHEVEEEIETKEMTSKLDVSEKGLSRSDSDPQITQDGLESSDAPLYRDRSRNGSDFYNWKRFTEGLGNLASLVISPTWVQVFVMTFLGEWGDRSQIATIAMAAGSDYWSVILGAIVGHSICTAAAVIGGKLLASKISMRTVTLGGAIAFFVFSLFYLWDSIYLPW